MTMTKTTISRELPMELIEEEILCYVPATYLKRLGQTCKRWNRLFNGDRRFAKKHMDRAKKQFLVLMKTSTCRICPTVINLHGVVPSVEVKSELSLVDSHSPQFNVCSFFHCDGLLLCTSEDDSRFVVWNPFTGETRWFYLSSRVMKGRTFVLGYYKKSKSCNDKSYKVLSFYLGRNVFEIYEFSTNSWRVLDDAMAPGWRIRYSYLSVSLKGSTYWFGRKSQESISLLKFDFSTEKCVPVPLPNLSYYFEVSGLSVVREEKLSVLLLPHETSKTEIWVTNKIDDQTTQVESWSKVLTLDLSPDLQLWPNGCFLLDEEKRVVTICERLRDMENETDTKIKEMMYIVKEDNEVTQVVLGVDVTGRYCHAILNYVPSLVQIERAAGN